MRFFSFLRAYTVKLRGTRRIRARTCTCVLRFQMLDPSVLTDLEELTLCGCCKQKYNDVEQCPKYLSCKHYFCLRCIENNLLKGRDLFCAHCWKKTDLGDQGPDALPTHSALLALANNLPCLKITPNNTSSKLVVDKERKVIVDVALGIILFPESHGDKKT